MACIVCKGKATTILIRECLLTTDRQALATVEVELCEKHGEK